MIEEGGLEAILGSGGAPALQLGHACTAGTSVWDSLAYDVGTGVYPDVPARACTACKGGEHLVLGAVARALRLRLPAASLARLDAVSLAGTERADETAAMQLVVDGLVRFLLAAAASADGREDLAARLRAIPSLRTKAGAAEAHRVVAEVMAVLAPPRRVGVDFVEGPPPRPLAATLHDFLAMMWSGVEAADRRARLHGFAAHLGPLLDVALRARAGALAEAAVDSLRAAADAARAGR